MTDERSNVTAEDDFLATGIEVRCCIDDDGQPCILIYTDNYAVEEVRGRPVLDVVLNNGEIWMQPNPMRPHLIDLRGAWGDGKPS